MHNWFIFNGFKFQLSTHYDRFYMKDFPWLKFYPSAVDKEVDLHAYNSLVDLFEESVEKFGDSVAYECMGKTLTYNDVDRYSAIFASFLQHELHLKKGDRVAIQMPNCLQYPVALFGILRAGMIVVNTNPLYTSSEMRHQFVDSGVAAIVILANFANNLEKIQQDVPIRHVIVTELGDLLGKIGRASGRERL